MKSTKSSGVKMFSEDERSQLSPDRYSKHANRVIRDVLLTQKNGLTVKDLGKSTGFNKGTIEKHLIELIAINFAYRKKFGTVYVYYPNGRTIHSAIEKDVPIGDKMYSLFRLDNDSGDKFIYIQEKKRDSVNALVPSGGILINEKFLTDFIKMIETAKSHIGGVNHA